MLVQQPLTGAQLLAQAGGGAPSLTGWYVGYAIAAVVVAVVVVVVLAIHRTAEAIAHQAGQAVEALDAAQETTHALWGVSDINGAGRRLRNDAQAARHALQAKL